MNEAGRAIIAILTSIIGLSIVAVVLSQQATTASIISASGTALSGVLSAATAPVTGGGTSSNALNQAASGILGTAADQSFD